MAVTLKSTFVITGMDCPSEEQMIRLKLEGFKQINHLVFDIPNRKLDVYHSGDTQPIVKAIHELNFNEHLERTEKADLPSLSDNSNQRKILWWVLWINFGFFIIEMAYGWISNSMGLVADSLDMLADSFVYGLSLMAIGATVLRKKQVAGISGYFQMILASLGFVEIIRRFFGFAETPAFQTMIIVSFLALIANSLTLYLIQKAKSQEAHMQASAIFTSNDIIINTGVIIAGILVYLTESKYPDLIVGLIIFLIVIRGAVRILKLSR